MAASKPNGSPAWRQSLSHHCGAFHIEVDAELTGPHECPCSTCVRSGSQEAQTQLFLGLDLTATERDLTPYFAPETPMALRRFASA
jgi:hypothetical protein